MTICEKFEYMMAYGNNSFNFWDFEINKRIEIDLPVNGNKQDKYATVKIDGVEVIREDSFLKFKNALKILQEELYDKGEM